MLLSTNGQNVARGTNPASRLFLYSLWAKGGGFIFKWLGKKIKIIILCGTWKLSEIQISLSVKKVSLEGCHRHLLARCLPQMLRCSTRGWLPQRPHGWQSLTDLPFGPSQKKTAHGYRLNYAPIPSKMLTSWSPDLWMRSYLEIGFL